MMKQPSNVCLAAILSQLPRQGKNAGNGKMLAFPVGF
jgi:hypothetical protein